MSESALRRLLSRLPLCDKACRRYVISLLWLILVLLPFYEYSRYQFHITQWDLLLFTGLATFILGLNLVAYVQVRFERTLNRLLRRRTLKMESGKRNRFRERVEENEQFWARVGGVVAAVAIFGAFAFVLNQRFSWSQALLGIGETIGAYVAGTYLGRMVSYGQLGWQLERESIEVILHPSHVDGVAGLKPLGDFYFYQAMVAAIPAIYLAVWWFLFPIWPRNYSLWENAYLALLSVAIIIETLAFLIPIWAFHRIMVRGKAKWQEEADKLSIELSELRRKKESGQSTDSTESLSDQIEGKTERFWAIENMPTWPVDIKTKRRFKLNNMLLFIPLLGDIAKRSVAWKDVLELLKQLV